MNKSVNFSNKVRCLFSAKYRREIAQKEADERRKAMLKQGKKLWKEKLETSKEKAPTKETLNKLFTPEEKASLLLFIDYEINNIEEDFYLVDSRVAERYERNRLQNLLECRAAL